jgi:hypothetical protein
VTPDQFRGTLSKKAPPIGLAPPLAALWWAGKGEWDKAHALVMDDASREAAWVHAYLHRVEGDLGNARYWYRQAGRAPATGAHEAEWTEIAQAFLQTGGCLQP